MEEGEDKIPILIEKINQNNNMSESEEDESDNEMDIDYKFHFQIDPQIMDNYEKMFTQKVYDYMDLHLDDTMDENLTFSEAKNIVLQEEDGSYHGNKFKNTKWILYGFKN